MIKGPSSILTTPKDASHGHVYTFSREREREGGKERNMEKESVVNGCRQDSTVKFQLDFRIRGLVRTVELVKLVSIA